MSGFFIGSQFASDMLRGCFDSVKLIAKTAKTAKTAETAETVKR